MAIEYLIEIHGYINSKIARAQSRKDEANANNELKSQRFY